MKMRRAHQSFVTILLLLRSTSRIAQLNCHHKQICVPNFIYIGKWEVGYLERGQILQILKDFFFFFDFVTLSSQTKLYVKFVYFLFFFFYQYILVAQVLVLLTTQGLKNDRFILFFCFVTFLTNILYSQNFDFFVVFNVKSRGFAIPKMYEPKNINFFITIFSKNLWF